MPLLVGLVWLEWRAAGGVSDGSLLTLVPPSSSSPKIRQSETFPLCNGAHMKHNEATGDNVGPLIVSTPKPST